MKCKCKAIVKVISPSPATIVANNVKTIQLMPTDATANPEDVRLDKIFYNNSGRQVGTLDTLFNQMKSIDLMRLHLNGNIQIATDEEYIQAKEVFNSLASLALYGGENG